MKFLFKDRMIGKMAKTLKINDNKIIEIPESEIFFYERTGIVIGMNFIGIIRRIENPSKKG